MTAGITGATRVYLHLAHPSAHARTPQVMNAEFARRGVDAVAVSADVAPADLGGFARGLRGWRNLAGLSVTMPHKESLAAHVDELIGAAALIGAVNVVRRETTAGWSRPTPTGRASSSGCVRPATSWPGGGSCWRAPAAPGGRSPSPWPGERGQPDHREPDREPGGAARS